MLPDLSKIVNIVTLFQLSILIYVVNSAKKGTLKNIWLISILCVNAYLVLAALLDKYLLLPFSHYKSMDALFRASFLLLGPLVYLYTKSVCFPSDKIYKKDLLHFVPALIVFIGLLSNYYFRANNSGDSNENRVLLFTLNHYFVYSFTFLLLFLSYIILSFKILKTYNRKIVSIYSSVENINLQWLNVLLYVLLFHWTFDAFFPVLVFFEIWDENMFALLDILSVSSLLIFSTFVVIKGLKQHPVAEITFEKPKYAESNLSREDCKVYISSLISFMEKEKPYLNPSLRIIDLADQLAIPAKSLSQAINQELGNNFFDFVNKYRIGEAKSKFELNGQNNKTILEILFDSGFNSKAAFNRAFKKHTGYTPTEFKKNIQSSQLVA
jgi:AraC-like DNA-binding protein